jgi:predicted ribosome quality control (RQC) complex YloA/Tae2 family protein
MYKNYFFLNRFILEADSVLKDYTCCSIFTQEKDRLIIQCRNGGIEKYIEVSVEPGSPFITLKDNYHRAKKNTINFFDENLPSKLLAVLISKTDRIIKIILDNGEIYFTIRGKYSNITFLGKDGRIEYFKNMPEDFNEEEFINEMKSGEFINIFNIPDLNITIKNDPWQEIKRAFPFIGKEILLEAKYRCENGKNEKIINVIKQILKEISTAKPIVIFDGTTGRLNIGFETLHIFTGNDINAFDDIVSAFNFYMAKHYYTLLIETKKKIISKQLEKELGKVSNKLNSIKAAIERGSKEAEYKKQGELLLININSIRSGMESIEVPDIFSDNSIINIKLDSALPPKKNIDRYFDKAKNDKIRLEKSKELYKISSDQFNKLKLLEAKLKQAGTIEDYNYLMKELKIKEAVSEKKDDDLSVKFKHYIIEDKYNVYVGKDSRNNDLLTTRFAKQNDYWFHARKVAGSHVVLQVESKKEGMPKSILSKTASLAAFHSKAKTSGLAPVSFALKKFVVKKKGMDPGEVAMMKEDVLIVKPEIPKGCEYISND